MIKRTVEISRKPAHLSVHLNQLVVQPHDEPQGASRSIPCEDIGFLVVDHGRATYSHHALASLVEHDAVVVICGRDHHPAGLLLPLAHHSQVVWRIHDQLAISKPRRKQMWKQIVQAKIQAQAINLAPASQPRGRLTAMVREVRSGDAGNCESQAARIYWGAWLPPHLTFRRDQSRDAAAPNNLLNYGYSIVRAAVARAIVSAGLLPAIGIHHHNRSNAFCLADDLVEPLRPIVDHRARELFLEHGRTTLDQPTKAGLLEVLTQRVTSDSESGPLMVALHRYVASFVRCAEGQADQLIIPRVEEDEP